MQQFSGRVDITRSTPSGTNTDGTPAPPIIRLDGDTGDFVAGGNGRDGDIVLKAATGQVRVAIDGAHASLWIGGGGADGDIVVFPSDAQSNTELKYASIHLDGQSGDIKLLHADVAEEFDVEPADGLSPGSVAVLTDDGCIRECTDPYDSKVVGVVSGAGSLQPAIILDRQPVADGCRLPVALMGKAYCKVDAEVGAIAIGDLLTTSHRPGHAMRATDRERAFGAVLGKALQPLAQGQGMISVLVTLQ